MKLGPRLALVTTLLTGCALGLSITLALRTRRRDLEQDLERQAREVAAALQAALEPFDPEGPRDLLEEQIGWAHQRKISFDLEVVTVGGETAPHPGWVGLISASRAEDRPVGRTIEPTEGEPVYVMVVPLHDRPYADPGRRPVAYLGMKRKLGYIDEEVSATAGRTIPVFVGGVLLFGLLVYGLLVRTVVQPLRRLLEGIDAVAHGDLSRAVFPQQNDEIGSLAARFNEMTTSLRDARERESRESAARSALEAKLRQSEKLATMGQMAAEIAHEVGTPLNVIGGRARSIAKRANDAADVQKNAEIIATQVDRITRIIRQVLDFSRKNRPALTQVHVDRIVTEALTFLSEQLDKRGVTAIRKVAPDLPGIPGDPDEIQQVVLNLATNALHAMPDGGTLTITLARVLRRKEGLDHAQPAEFLMMEFADTGTGLPPGDREKLFEAFFTTKDTGEGTGLGLAVSKGIIKDHDGWIEADERPGGGAIFRVFLPVAQGE